MCANYELLNESIGYHSFVFALVCSTCHFGQHWKPVCVQRSNVIEMSFVVSEDDDDDDAYTH